MRRRKKGFHCIQPLEFPSSYYITHHEQGSIDRSTTTHNICSVPHETGVEKASFPNVSAKRPFICCSGCRVVVLGPGGKTNEVFVFREKERDTTARYIYLYLSFFLVA